MDVDEAVEQWLATAAREALPELLAAWPGGVTLAHIAALKDRSDARLRADPAQARFITEVADLAASFCAHPLAQALARWAQANVLSYQGEYETCLALYQEAQAAYAQHGAALDLARLQSNQVAALNYLGRYEEALALADRVRAALEPPGPTRFLASLEMNAGFAHRYVGQYQQALAAYQRSRAIWRDLGREDQAARVDVNRANVLRDLDRFHQAESLLEQVRPVLLAHEQTLDVARVDLSRGLLAHRQGHHQAALDLLDQAREGFDSLGNQMESAVTDLHHAAVYADLNLWPEAQTAARAARPILTHHGLPRQAAQAQRIEAAVLWRSGDLVSAQRLLAAAQTFFSEAGATTEAALLDLDRAQVALAAGEQAAAQERVTAALAIFPETGVSVPRAQAHLLQARIHLVDDDLPAAAASIQAAQSAVGDLAVRDVLWRVAYGLGQVAERQGRLAAAARHYETSLAHIEAWRDELLTDVLRASFGADKQEVYEAAVRVALAREQWDAALGLVERSRSSSLLDWVSREVQAHDHPVDEDTQHLLDRLAELRAQWHWQRHALDPTRPTEDAGPPRSVAAADPRAWEELARLELRLSEVWRRLQARSRTPQPPPACPVALASDARLLTYYAVGGQLMAFVQGPGVRVIPDLADLAGLRDRVRRFRLALESVKLFEADARPAERAAMLADAAALSHDLYQALVAPLEPNLVGVRQLILVPHDVLHYLPFAALHDGQDYLLARFEIHNRLSGRPGLQRRSVESAPPVQAAVLGASLAGALPGVTHELAAVREALTPALAVQVREEESATLSQLRDLVPGADVVHLACHGAFRADNPLFSALQLADACLMVHDVYDLDLRRAALVTLSACETGVGAARGGELLGLSRALFRAGARAALVSLWRVDDAATAYLMGAFYRRLMAGASLATALRQAQEETRVHWPHPFYWAPFVLVGADGGVKRET